MNSKRNINKTKFIFLIFILLILFIYNVIAKTSITAYVKESGSIGVVTNIEGKITTAMEDNLRSGIEANIKYSFSLYKRNTTFGISTFSIIKSIEYEYNLRWDNLNLNYVIYNKNDSFNFNNLNELEKFIFNHEFENIFTISPGSKYFIKMDFSFETLKLVPPFSFILWFVNIYNIKVYDIQSNDVIYEVSKKN